tara:strand:- start:6230 stop:6718 length:489 start_codon:yes stop_codon:yes gene_type:complete
MAEYTAKILWKRDVQERFIDNKYSRGHLWQFDGGETIKASSSSHIVPIPYSVEANVDPEEAFIASISSCQMLFFLSIVAKHSFTVDQYIDNAIGIMGKNSDGKVSMTKVTLRPYVTFSGEKQPTISQLEKLHHEAHERCFIANSIKTQVITEIVMDPLETDL